MVTKEDSKLVWNIICKAAFDNYAEIKFVGILNENNWFDKEEFLERQEEDEDFDEEWYEDETILAGKVTDSRIYPIADYDLIRIMNWQDMPITWRPKEEFK